MIDANSIQIGNQLLAVLALIGIRLLTFIFSRSILVRNDAPVSVKRGFLKPELLNLLKDLGISDYKIKLKWAFRWLIVIPKRQYV